MQEDGSAERKCGSLLFRKKKCLEVRCEGVQRGVLTERKGKVKGKVILHVEGPKTEKVREPTVGSLGTRNLEADRDSQKQSRENRRLCEVEDTQPQREDGAVRVVYL